MTDHTDSIAKYGMPASESEKLVERHFEVTTTQRAAADDELAHLLRVGPSLTRALLRLSGRGD